MKKKKKKKSWPNLLRLTRVDLFGVHAVYCVLYGVCSIWTWELLCTCFHIDFVVSARNNSDFFPAYLPLTLPIGYIYLCTLWVSKEDYGIIAYINLYTSYIHRDVSIEKGNKIEIYFLLNCNSFLSRRIYEPSKWILKLTDKHTHAATPTQTHTFTSIQCA